MTPRPSTGPTREAPCQSRTQTRKRTSPHRVHFCPSRPDPGVTVALDRHAWPAAHSLPFCLLVGPRPPHSSSAPLSLVHSRRCYSPSSPRRVRFQLVLAGGAREPRGRRPRRGRGAPLSRAWWGGRRAVCACARLPVPRTASSRRALRPRRDIVRAHGPASWALKNLSVSKLKDGRWAGRSPGALPFPGR